jgi:hypothetical protein
LVFFVRIKTKIFKYKRKPKKVNGIPKKIEKGESKTIEQVPILQTKVEFTTFAIVR